MNDYPFHDDTHKLSAETSAEVTAAEQVLVRELRAATPATGESRADLKNAVCDYVDRCKANGIAADVAQRMVRQLVIDALDLNTNNLRDPRNEAYAFVNQVTEWCIKQYYTAG